DADRVPDAGHVRGAFRARWAGGRSAVADELLAAGIGVGRPDRPAADRPDAGAGRPDRAAALGPAAGRHPADRSTAGPRLFLAVVGPGAVPGAAQPADVPAAGVLTPARGESKCERKAARVHLDAGRFVCRPLAPVRLLLCIFVAGHLTL